MRVLMTPHLSQMRRFTSGIDQVVRAYFLNLPKFGVTMVEPDSTRFDLVAVHVSADLTEANVPVVCHVHGLHWTADYDCDAWQWGVNAEVINTIRKAHEVTVPSSWVAETFQRDMRFTPHVIPHGVDVDEWDHDAPMSTYVLWNKNRDKDVCSSLPVVDLARRFPEQHFVTTFLPKNAPSQKNVHAIGVIPHDQMKKLVQGAQVYLATTKETFGIGTLEAMASGVPVLAFNHGGNAFLVEHGVNGYLAKPEDYDDLAEGLIYCQQHRDTLGANGREMAKQWTWEAACELVAGVYQKALEPEPPTVAVVIPCYNYAEKVGRAIESVFAQTYQHIEKIIVVDDGSPDDGATRRVVERYSSIDKRVQYTHQENAGVAIARNYGADIAEHAKYISCLDADDAMGPTFIEHCVRTLEADRSLGIAYTGLWYIKPDGSEGLSQWPGKFDYDASLQRRTQIPTCNVFRRKMWERLGGYKQRYAPDGCGEEDAEFWLRAGAYGWGAKFIEPVEGFNPVYHHIKDTLQHEPSKEELVRNSGITAEEYDKMHDSWFVYSWQSGQVSGNSDHKITDYAGWHPWTKDEQHPFASVATPEGFSHAVRAYDAPMISVVIPVGPGHEQQVINALDSLEAQTFRKWEAIVVWDTWGAPDNDAPASFECRELQRAYPYIRLVNLDRYSDEFDVFEIKPIAYLDESEGGRGSKGPGYARNRGAEIARAPFLFFLDADDQLYPEALQKHIEGWREHESIIYSDYVGRSIVTAEHVEKLNQRGKLLEILKDYGDGHFLVVSGPSGVDFLCEKAQRQPELDTRGNPYLWCNVTALVPLAWHQVIGGFDESLESWEDIDYHWRMAKAGYCYTRIPEPLLVYDYHQGNRRERGRQNHESLLQLLKEKHGGIEVARGCSGCGRSRAQQNKRTTDVFEQQQENTPSDSEFMLIEYLGPQGTHNVTGVALFPEPIPGYRMVKKRERPSGYSIRYGQNRSRGDRFLVHKEDVRLLPGKFRAVEETVATNVPEPVQEPLGTPEPISTPAPPDAAIETEQETASVLDDLAGGVLASAVEAEVASGTLTPPESIGTSPVQATVEAIVELEEAGLLPEAPTGELSPLDVVSGILQGAPPAKAFDLQKIPGVSVSIASQLKAAGKDSAEEVLALGIGGLRNLKGVGDKRAELIIRHLQG